MNTRAHDHGFSNGAYLAIASCQTLSGALAPNHIARCLCVFSAAINAHTAWPTSYSHSTKCHGVLFQIYTILYTILPSKSPLISGAASLQ